MHSKMFSQRSRDAEALLSSIHVFKDDVAAGLGKRLAPELAEGETLPDFGLSLELVGRSVESALEHLRVAERRYLELGTRCTKVRRQTEKLARREVYPRVVSVRRLIESQFGREEGRRVHGMAGKTLRKPWRLHGQLQYLVWALEDGSGELPAPLLKSVAAKREVWLSEVKPGFERLTELLDDLVQLQVREQSAQVEKNQAMKAFDDAYGEARRLVEANFVFAGLGSRLTRWLRSQVHRRLLAREARRKREARAEGRVKHTLRSAASSVKSWIGRRRPEVA